MRADSSAIALGKGENVKEKKKKKKKMEGKKEKKRLQGCVMGSTTSVSVAPVIDEAQAAWSG